MDMEGTMCRGYSRSLNVLAYNVYIYIYTYMYVHVFMLNLLEP